MTDGPGAGSRAAAPSIEARYVLPLPLAKLLAAVLLFLEEFLPMSPEKKFLFPGLA